MKKSSQPAIAVGSLPEIDDLLELSGLERGKHQSRSQRLPQTQSASIAKPAQLPRSPVSQRSKRNGPVVLQVPAWKQYAWLVHGFSTRPGGTSTIYCPDAKCGELNLGLTAADAAENVHRNRDMFLDAVRGSCRGRELRVSRRKSSASQTERDSLYLLRQIHSGMVHRIDGTIPKGTDAQGKPLLRGDGLIASVSGAVLGIQTADCIPVLVADVRRRVVGAFHAGWRGTLARIVERGVGRMRAEFGCRPEDMTAAIGPGVGVCCYSVGEEVRSGFRSQFVYADELFQEVFDLDPIKEKYPMLFLTARAPGHSNLGPNLHLDLMEANRRQLVDAGLSPESVHVLGLCTACDTAHFFSHRAEHGFTGRMLSVIGIVEQPNHP